MGDTYNVGKNNGIVGAGAHSNTFNQNVGKSNGIVDAGAHSNTFNQIGINSEKVNDEELAKFLAEVKKYMPVLRDDLHEEKTKELETQLQVIEEQKALPPTQRTKLQKALELTKEILKGAAGSIAGSGLLALLDNIFIGGSEEDHLLIVGSGDIGLIEYVDYDGLE